MSVLASIIVPCCGQEAYTRLCLESVLRHTEPPYELIIIDNASGDGTLIYLESLAGGPGPTRLEVARNGANLGHPRACNQGLALARGELVAFLDNDVVLTPGWLPALRRRLDLGGVALAGPVSNAASGRQLVPAGYDTLAGLDDFAERHRAGCAGRTRLVSRLSGFCLLACREAVERLGGFDERFSPGFFADDDLCLRAADGGHKIALADDVYVHHFGGRTFAGLGLDAHRLLEEGLARFKQKWGEARAARYRLPPRPSGAATTASPPDSAVPASAAPAARVSLCLIVKDEEENLPHCLGGVAGLFPEVVVVDTGSRDRTREVARGYGAKVYDHPWEDSFASARNECLRRAEGDYIFWLDADDRLDAESQGKLRALLRALNGDPVGYLLPCLCPPEVGSEAPSVVEHLRLFRRLPGLAWQYRVHEQILVPFKNLGGAVRRADVTVRHVGYLDPALRSAKLRRDMRLLRLDLRDKPQDSFVPFNLGWVCLQLGQPGEALGHLRRSRELMPPKLSIRAKLHALTAHCLTRLGRPEEALAACAEGLAGSPADRELMFLEATLLHQLGRPAEAEPRLLAVLASPQRGAESGLDLGLSGFKARHNLALVYRTLGRAADEEEQWRAVRAALPLSAEARLGLGELFLRQKRADEFAELLAELEVDPRFSAEALILRAQGELQNGQAARACGLLAEALRLRPNAANAHLLRGHALARLGDRDAARRDFEQALAIDPHCSAARRRLADSPL